MTCDQESDGVESDGVELDSVVLQSFGFGVQNA